MVEYVGRQPNDADRFDQPISLFVDQQLLLHPQRLGE